jgi:hypothetical protein
VSDDAAKLAAYAGEAVLIKAHQRNYLVELEDGSRWRIWPPDMYGTLRWSPSTDLRVLEIDDTFSTHALVDQDRTRVRVISADADWTPRRMRGHLIAAE